MSGPIVFISHFKIKDGKLDDLRRFAQETAEQIKADKPGTLVFLQYLNADATEQSIVHVFPDAEAFDRHSEGAAERAKAAFEYITLVAREVYGSPSDKAMAMLRPPESSPSTLTLVPDHMGGYVRPSAPA